MEYSIIPRIINSKKIQFSDEKDIEVTLCPSSNLTYQNPFSKPFLIIDSFAKKTTQPKEIVGIELDELKKLGFVITSIRAGRHKWFQNQRVIYRIESLSNLSPGSKKINFLPTGHKIEKDIINNVLRLIGPNAGFPRRGSGGPWFGIK